MEKLSNLTSIVIFNVRKHLGLKSATIAPVLWSPSKITKNHMPSEHFRAQNAQNAQKVEKVLRELTLISKMTFRFPKKLSDQDWTVLLELSRKQRLSQLNFLFRKEVMGEERRQEKEGRRRIEREQKPHPQVDTFLLPRPSDTSESWMKYRKILNAFQNPTESLPILAVDCQFIPNLSARGRSLTALQLQYLATENRQNSNPFRLFFIGYNRKEKSIMDLERSKLEWLTKPSCVSPIVTDQGAEVFKAQHQKVIYLSPDAEKELDTVDTSTVYIIGGIVDRVPERGIPKHASLEAAQKFGVEARKLPIDRYIDFKSGSRFLTLLAVAELLREVHLHGNWKKAMEKAIPVRNTRGVEEKNPTAMIAKKKVVNFNNEVLRRLENCLGKE